jgi:hypothetical protein
VNEKGVDAGRLRGFVTFRDIVQLPPAWFAGTVLLQLVVTEQENEAV